MKKILVLIIILFLYSCTGICYYDETSYKNFTFTKPETLLFIKDFTNSGYLDKNKKDYINLKMVQLYEYEKRKRYNSNTIRQFELLNSIFTNYIYVRDSNTNPWPLFKVDNSVMILNRGWDILIETEEIKERRK